MEKWRERKKIQTMMNSWKKIKWVINIRKMEFFIIFWHVEKKFCPQKILHVTHFFAIFPGSEMYHSISYYFVGGEFGILIPSCRERNSFVLCCLKIIFPSLHPLMRPYILSLWTVTKILLFASLMRGKIVKKYEAELRERKMEKQRTFKEGWIERFRGNESIKKVNTSLPFALFQTFFTNILSSS